MMARGDQVRLPHGRGVGLVLDCSDGMVNVFVGSKPGGEPIVDEYVECELMLTGKHFAKPARDALARLQLRCSR